ncbi:hypothetical protein C8Q75DRAFT_741606 [Abortiporus biennis]|nr:hypothetical protein C8Q75DRAFT_741606 [Abortiporus biennis]
MTSLFPSPCPVLPGFNTLLIHGPYHWSAPIHLCLSHIAQHPESQAVILAPSRHRFRGGLLNCRDDWLNVHGGEGLITHFASKVQILYPPKLPHLNFTLSLLHETQPSFKNFYNSKVSFSVSPSFLVLCEISAYVEKAKDPTVSTYLSIVTRALATLDALSSQCVISPSLVIFDSRVGQFKLPILTPIVHHEDLREEEKIKSSPMAKSEPVLHFAGKYFDWVGSVHEDRNVDSRDPQCNRKCRLELSKRHNSETFISWKEYSSPGRHDAIVFVFEPSS